MGFQFALLDVCRTSNVTGRRIKKRVADIVSNINKTMVSQNDIKMMEGVSFYCKILVNITKNSIIYSLGILRNRYMGWIGSVCGRE